MPSTTGGDPEWALFKEQAGTGEKDKHNKHLGFSRNIPPKKVRNELILKQWNSTHFIRLD